MRIKGENVLVYKAFSRVPGTLLAVDKNKPFLLLLLFLFSFVLVVAAVVNIE